MRISLLFEAQRPEPDHLDYDHLVIKETLDQVTLADQAGFSTAWLTEHHFLRTFSHSPHQDLLLAALSQRTTNIRLGVGATILPYHHPIHVAERIAILDQISDGRVEWGTGRGNPYEQVGFGIDPLTTRQRWAEALDIVCKIWQTEGDFSYEGEFWVIPPRDVLPKPRQSPHPPIWVASNQAESFALAADKGLGVLSFNPNRPLTLAPEVVKYREAIQVGTPVGAFANNQWANFVTGICGEDDKAAKELGAAATREFFGPGKPYAAAARSLFRQIIEQWGDEAPESIRKSFEIAQNGDLTGTAEADAAVNSLWNRISPERLVGSGAIIAGNPESCIESLRQHHDIGADEVIIVMQTLTTSPEQVMKSIELFGEHVIPEVSSWEVRDAKLSDAAIKAHARYMEATGQKA